ncbi:MAG TPA: hypothetical protein VFJ00_04425, partial [Candidatus Limnocylindria bacterium]|nr:hypothetical protein [Candidatus Limnocylindria bacterium]
MMRRMARAGWRGPATALLGVVLGACATPIPSSPTPTATDPFHASLEATARPGIVFRLARNEVASWLPHLTLYDDGRLLQLDRALDSLSIQQLTPAGVDAFVAEVQASGSFGASHDVPLELLPGVEAPGIDVPGDRFTLTLGGAEAVVVTTSPYRDPLVFQASPEREALIALAERVMDRSWLPAEGWIEASAEPFVPAAYLVFSGVVSFPGLCPPGSDTLTCRLDMSTIELPFQLPPDGIGPVISSADGRLDVVNHCAVISPKLADALALAVSPDLSGAAGHLFLDATIPWRE